MSLKRYFTALRRYHRSKGHGIHSPFAFSFVLNVLRERLPYYGYEDILALRKQAIKTTRRNWLNHRVISFKNAKLLFRVANYFNPKAILQIGDGDGITEASMLLVANNIVLHLYGSSTDSAQSVAHFGNRIISHDAFSDSKNAYANSNAPFVLINSLDEKDYDNVAAYLQDVCNSNGVIIFRNISNNNTNNKLWEACKDSATTGMTFSNGKTAIIVASPKLPHQNFSLWF